jgi:hypothetical protein
MSADQKTRRLLALTSLVDALMLYLKVELSFLEEESLSLKHNAPEPEEAAV